MAKPDFASRVPPEAQAQEPPPKAATAHTSARLALARHRQTSFGRTVLRGTKHQRRIVFAVGVPVEVSPEELACLQADIDKGTIVLVES